MFSGCFVFILFLLKHVCICFRTETMHCPLKSLWIYLMFSPMSPGDWMWTVQFALMTRAGSHTKAISLSGRVYQTFHVSQFKYYSYPWWTMMHYCLGGFGMIHEFISYQCFLQVNDLPGCPAMSWISWLPWLLYHCWAGISGLCHSR